MYLLTYAVLAAQALTANLVTSSFSAIDLERRSDEIETIALSASTITWVLPTKDQSSSIELPTTISYKDKSTSATILFKDQASTTALSAQNETTIWMPASSTTASVKDITSSSSVPAKDLSATSSTTSAKDSMSVPSVSAKDKTSSSLVPTKDMSTTSTTIPVKDETTSSMPAKDMSATSSSAPAEDLTTSTMSDSTASLPNTGLPAKTTSGLASTVPATSVIVVDTLTNAITVQLSSATSSAGSLISSKPELSSITVGRMPIGPLMGYTSSFVESASSANLNSTPVYTLSAPKVSSTVARIPIGPLMGYTSSLPTSESSENLVPTLVYSSFTPENTTAALKYSSGPSSSLVSSTNINFLSLPLTTVLFSSFPTKSEPSKVASTVTSVKIWTVTGTPRVIVSGNSTIIPLYTPGILGNAYGGGYITIPSIYVTTTTGPIVRVPPGYGFSLTPEGSTILVSVPAAATSYSIPGETPETPKLPYDTSKDEPAVGPTSVVSASGNQTFSAPAQPSSPTLFQGTASKESVVLISVVLGLFAVVLIL